MPVPKTRYMKNITDRVQQIRHPSFQFMSILAAQPGPAIPVNATVAEVAPGQIVEVPNEAFVTSLYRRVRTGGGGDFAEVPGFETEARPVQGAGYVCPDCGQSFDTKKKLGSHLMRCSVGEGEQGE